MPSFCGYAADKGEAIAKLLRYSEKMRTSCEYYGIVAEEGVGLCAAAPFSYPLPFRQRFGRRPLLAVCLGTPRPKRAPRLFSYQPEKMLLATYFCDGPRGIERTFEGDFSLVIQDVARRRLFLAAFGENKLFIGEEAGVFWFSSQPIAPCTVQIEKGLYRLRR